MPPASLLARYLQYDSSSALVKVSRAYLLMVIYNLF